MDEDMSFPNPVERHDLPVKKPRWPKVVAGMLILGVFVLAFLPQILHTRIGRRFLRARLESKYAGEVTIDDFHTSWFGGTSAKQFWIKAGDGRTVGCASFQSDKLSLLKLLRSKYDLGHCTIDGMVVEYLLDNGESNHLDSYERLTGTPARVAGMPPATLSKLSGQITLRNSQLSLSRGGIDPNSLLATSQTVKFTGLSGTFEIPSLDQPWKFDVEGAEGLKAAGTLCLGRAGLLTGGDVSADVTASMDHVSSDMAAVLLPQIDVVDSRSAFGSRFDEPQMTLKGNAGVLTLNAHAAAERGKIDLTSTFDLKSEPAHVSLTPGQQAAVECNLPAGSLMPQMAILNPLLVDATGGTITLHITGLDAPFARAWANGSGQATLEFRDLKWAPHPGPLARQVAAAAGSAKFFTDIHCGPETFSFDHGKVTVSPTDITAGNMKATLAGEASMDGKLSYTLAVSSPDLADIAPRQPVRLLLNGSASEPRIDLDLRTTSPNYRQWVASKAEALHRHELEERQREKDREIQELVKPLAGSGGQ